MKSIKYSELNTKKLLESVWYDLLTGEFYWLPDRPLWHFRTEGGRNIWRSKFAGKKIISFNDCNKKTPYPQLTIGTHAYLCHTVAWRILYGVWPDFEIDHIDRNGGNNLPRNLQAADRFIQNQNKDLYKSNRYGVAGIHTYSGNIWVVKYGNKYLKSTRDFFEACCIRKAFELTVSTPS